jgi:hypothetical protein
MNMALRIDVAAVEGVKYELTLMSAAEAPLFQVRGKENEGLALRNIGIRATDTTIYVVLKSGWIGTGKESRRGSNPEKPYTLSVAKEEAGANAEMEPNDELAKATPLLPNGFREGFLSPKSDVDYYVVHAGQPSQVKVQLTGVDKVDLVLGAVMVSDGGVEKIAIRANDGVVKEPEYMNNVACAPDCYFRVEGGMRKGPDGKLVKDYENAEQPYRISVTVVPDNGSEEREPNNTAEAAMPIELGKAVRGTVHPKRDADFYRLDLSGRPVKTSIKASVLGILKVDVGLYLHQMGEDGRAALVQTADRAKGEAPEIIRYSAEPGVYLLEVRDAKNRESNFQDSYQLTVEEGE